MGGRSASEIICLSVNHSITLVGKVWLMVMVLLRILVLLLAGYPLYQDEQERFVCNTIQPGCANVCYDLFSPVSLFRFWLVQLLVLCLPYLVFIIYVVHKVSSGLSAEPDAGLETSNVPLKKLPQGERRWTTTTTQHFTGAYILHLLLRIVLEAGFGATHYYLFGFYIPSRFLCQKPPCTTQVDCYISRPTEKSVMLSFMLGAGALCLLLNALDLVCAVKRSVRQRSKRKLLVQKVFEEERYYTASQRAADTTSAPLVSQEPEGEVSHAGSFRKKGLGRESTGGLQEHSSLSGSPGSPPPGAPGSNTNTNGNNGGYTQEEAPDVAHLHGSEVALFSQDPLMGTPRAIRVSKRGRLKPPPPPRRGDAAAALAGSLQGHVSDGSTAAAAVCARKVGQYTLVELSSGAELQASDGDGPDKRSEWV